MRAHPRTPPTSDSDPTEQRRAARHRPRRGATALLALVGRKATWPAGLHDISRDGVGVLLDFRFEPGSRLAVEFWKSGRRVRTRVVVRHVQAEADGQWRIGSAFARPLSQTQLGHVT